MDRGDWWATVQGNTRNQRGLSTWYIYKNISAQFSCSVVSNSCRAHGLQHVRPLCPLPTPRAYPNSGPSSLWCHPTISSSVVPFSSCLQSFPVSGSFPMSQFFPLGGKNIGVSPSASVLPMNIQGWFPLGWTGWIPLQSKGLSTVFYKHHTSKASILQCWAFFIFQISHLYMTTGKPKFWLDGPLLAK